MTQEDFLYQCIDVIEHWLNGKRKLSDLREVTDKLYNEVIKPHWISVEDELPPTSDKDDESDDYLIVDSDGDKNVGYYNKMDELWFSYDGYILDVTHWMPLPQAPLVTDLNKKDLPPLGRQEGNILVEKKGGENEQKDS